MAFCIMGEIKKAGVFYNALSIDITITTYEYFGIYRYKTEHHKDFALITMTMAVQMILYGHWGLFIKYTIQTTTCPLAWQIKIILFIGNIYKMAEIQKI